MSLTPLLYKGEHNCSPHSWHAEELLWLDGTGALPGDRPTVEVELPKLTEPEAQNLKEEEVAQIYQAVAGSSLPDRNIALISVLLHGLRAEEVCGLNLEDDDGWQLHIREAKADSKGFVPLTTQAKQDFEQYLQ